jgi:hypothetical protein
MGNLTADKLESGKTYVLKRDFIQNPQIRHNFGTEVVFLGTISSDRQRVIVKVKGATNGGFMVPIDILTEKS